MTCCMSTQVLGINTDIYWLKSISQEYVVLAKQKYSSVPDKKLQHTIQSHSSLWDTARIKAFYSS